jgi:hypothetical protein
MFDVNLKIQTMKKCYILSFLLPLLFACSTGTQINYIGNSFEPTQRVDVFVDENAITDPYKVIGKGYIKTNYFTKPEQIQEKAIVKAKEKGADAVLIKDYYVPNTGAAINTTMHTDSVGKGTVSVGTTTVQQTGSSGFTVLFLKYR